MTSVSPQAALEAILFVAGKPMTIDMLAKHVGISKKEASGHLKALHDSYTEREAGLALIFTDNAVQLYTAAAVASVVDSFLEEETAADLTKPQLETLSIIAYRGPLIKEMIEEIRGVNCTLILRNLLLRGLVQETKRQDGLYYEVSHDFLAHLGAQSVEELPEYETLHAHENVEKILNTAEHAAD